MTDKNKLTENIERGRQAEALLSNPLFTEAFDKIKKVVEDGWRNSEAADHEGRHNAYLLQRLLRDLEEEFKRIVRTGHEASVSLVNLAKKEKESVDRPSPKPGT